MTFFESTVLGFIQGVTEFLPISSTGHLWIAETYFFGMEGSIALEAVFHFATVLAVVLIFWKRIWSLLCSVFLFGDKATEETSLAWKLLAATGITGIFGILLKPYLEFGISASLVASTLCITGVFILISEYFSSQKNTEFTWFLALFLGFVQAIAVLPGISRSGITIVFLLLVGIGKKKSLEISFLLSIPTILGSFVFLLPDIQNESFSLPVLLAGGVVAFITAYFTITAMMSHIQRVWKWFALWCFCVAGLLFLFA